MMKIFSQMRKARKDGKLIVKLMNSKNCSRISWLRKLKKRRILL